MKSEKGFAEIVAIVFIIAVVIGLFVLLGIAIKEEADFGTKEGIVIDKEYTSSYTTIIYSGKVMIPQYHPESYQIKIEKEMNGTNKAIWISVDSETYHNTNIGDSYPSEEE